MAACDNHNILAPLIAKQILTDTASAAEALIVCESVLFGVLIAQAGTRELAVAWLETMTERIVERLTPTAMMPETYDQARQRFFGTPSPDTG